MKKKCEPWPEKGCVYLCTHTEKHGRAGLAYDNPHNGWVIVDTSINSYWTAKKEVFPSAREAKKAAEQIWNIAKWKEPEGRHFFTQIITAVPK